MRLARRVGFAAVGALVAVEGARRLGLLPDPETWTASHTAPPPALPIVLCHGFLGGSGWPDLDGKGRVPSLAYFRTVAECIEEESGRPVVVTVVPPAASIELRAAALARQIELFVGTLREQLQQPDLRVNIIAHSMGGLDARRAVHLLRENEVASVTTVGTPHAGSALAPHARGLPPVLGGLADLSPAAMRAWDCPDAPGVLYFSVAGEVTLSPLHPLFAAQALLRALDPGPSDGLVTAASARHGQPLPPVPLDHWAQLGWSLHGGDEHLRLLYRPLLENLVSHRL